MDNLGDMRSAVQSDFTVGSESSLYPPATIDLALNRSYRKIGALFKWADTKDALKTKTIENHEWYDYPQNWRPNSIWKLVVNAVDYGEPLTYKDYMYEKENNFPSGLTKAWANDGKKYFIYPTPTQKDLEIDIYGYKFVEKMVLDGDITIFSYSMPDVNEAIVLEADAILKNKGQIVQPVMRTFVGGAILLSDEAKNIVFAAWAKVSQENMKNQNTTPQWDVPDYFSNGVNNQNAIRNKTGNF